MALKALAEAEKPRDRPLRFRSSSRFVSKVKAWTR
jgi:hypothetical protein